MAKFDLSDDSVVVIIGSGAGGGTAAVFRPPKGAVARTASRASPGSSTRLRET